MDTQENMKIVGQGDGYYDVSVTFEHKWNRGWWIEEEETIRIERNETGDWRFWGNGAGGI